MTSLRTIIVAGAAALDDGQAPTRILGHLWPIAALLPFYIVWPVVLRGLHKRPAIVEAIVATLLFILSLAGLSRHETARRGVTYGIAGMTLALLATAGVVWLGNNLAFGLLYWLLDSGGPMRRMRSPAPVDFAFTQQMSPELAPPGWRPVFLDYLHLGFTNATAFSPTDVMPLTHRAKYTMLVQSTVALALFALVVARAVNAFT